MGVGIGGGGVSQGQPGTGNPDNQPQWQTYLEKFPEPQRPIAEGVFREWDANVSQRFNQYAEQLRAYEPYNEIVQEWEPGAIQQAIALAQALEADPEGFFNKMLDSYGFEVSSGEPEGEPQYGENEGEFTDPRYDNLEQAVVALAEMFQGQQRSYSEEKEEAEVIAYLEQLQKQHGEYDWAWVLTRAAAGQDPEEAVKEYLQLTSGAGQNGQNSGGQPGQPVWPHQNNAPVVMGSGSGGVPNPPPPDLKQGNVRENLMAQMIQAANQQQQ